MRIAILTASLSRQAGGVYDALRRLSLEQAAFDGSSIQVFGLLDSSTSGDLAGWNGLPVKAATVSGPRFFGYSRELLRNLCAARIDLVHQHGIWMYPSVACRAWSSRQQKPCIISPHGMLDPWALGYSRWKKWLASWLYESRNLRGAACLHALCEPEALAIREYGLNNPVCVIPNGIDPPSSRKASPPIWEDAELRGENVLLYLGRLHPKKNLLNLLRAWSITQNRDAEEHGWTLVIGGWDQNGHQAMLQRAADELGISNSVRFIGAQFGEAKHATLCRANAFVLPSLSEGLPMAILEAWAYGLPVLMTPECHLAEGFHFDAALKIHTGTEDIAAGLMKVLEMTGEDRKTMGGRGQRLVQERFSWPKIAAQMRCVYEWVLGGGNTPETVTTL